MVGRSEHASVQRDEVIESPEIREDEGSASRHGTARTPWRLIYDLER